MSVGAQNSDILAFDPGCRVSVVIVTHNHGRFIGACLDSLAPEAGRIAMEVIVVDNTSTDDSAAIARLRPGVRVLVNERRRGFAQNCNRGMALGRGQYLLLLNPDTQIIPGAVETLASYMDVHAKVGLCGPRLLYKDGRFQPSARHFPTVGVGLVRRSPWRVFLRETASNRRHLMLDDDLSSPQPVDWLLGACLMVRRETLAAVGPMDEGYPLYVEDIDWARRIHAAGWDVCFVPTASIVHDHQAASDERFFSRAMWLHTRSMVRYVRKYMYRRVPGLSLSGNIADVWQATLRERCAPGERSA